MKSLLYKDFMNLKQLLRFYVIIIACYAFLGFKQGNVSVLGGVMVVFAVMLAITACAYDERAGWDKYALTMPFRIKDLIISKYILSMLGIAASLVFMTVANFIAGVDVEEILGTAALFLAVGLFGMDIILPVIFRFGVEKGRVLMILAFILPSVIFVMFGNRAGAFVTPQMLVLMMYASPVAGLVLVPVSILLSISFYKKKEF